MASGKLASASLRLGNLGLAPYQWSQSAVAWWRFRDNASGWVCFALARDSAEICGVIMESEAFDYLDAPVERITVNPSLCCSCRLERSHLCPLAACRVVAKSQPSRATLTAPRDPAMRSGSGCPDAIRSDTGSSRVAAGPPRRGVWGCGGWGAGRRGQQQL